MSTDIESTGLFIDARNDRSKTEVGTRKCILMLFAQVACVSKNCRRRVFLVSACRL